METKHGLLNVSRSLVIPLKELHWTYLASGGPGGQHSNKNATKVVLTFDIEHSDSLGPRQRSKLLERYGPILRVVASRERSQLRNRETALLQLKNMLADPLKVKKTRIPTKKSHAVEEVRLSQKKRQSEKKRLRQRLDLE